MWLLRERLSDFRVNKSYFELIALYLHPKNSNHLRLHLWAVMALGHSRLGLENCFLENKLSGRFSLRSTSSLHKILPTKWVRVRPFILFIHHIWGETVLWGAVFIIQTSDRIQYFTFFQDKLHAFNIQDHRLRAWAFRGTVQKIFKITYTARFWDIWKISWYVGKNCDI